jgi:ElaB/YqjD/DUF883 family membrane-anchored ribosome-binding protein
MDELTSSRSAEQARELGNDLSDTATHAVDQADQAQHGIKQVGSKFKRALDQSTADQPLATLALAAMVGFLLGAIWKA